MITNKFTIALAVAAAAIAVGMAGPIRADDSAKAVGAFGSFWTLPTDPGKLTLILAGRPDPVTVTVTDTTVIAGICLDCSLPMQFKPGDAGKKCAVCGCSANNASCIVGKSVKEGTWQAMFKGLPRGVGLHPTFNTADKPESGLQKVAVDLRTVLLPVSGLDSQTPQQLLALVTPLGGTQAELIDGAKRLTIHLKSDWTTDRETKLEKALAKINAKVVVPEDPKPAQ